MIFTSRESSHEIRPVKVARHTKAVLALVRHQLVAVFFRHLPKVVTHGGERQAMSKVAGVMTKKLIKIVPKVGTRAVTDAEHHYDLVKRPEVFEDGG
jgi:hypothetical protein